MPSRYCAALGDRCKVAMVCLSGRRIVVAGQVQFCLPSRRGTPDLHRNTYYGSRVMVCYDGMTVLLAICPYVVVPVALSYGWQLRPIKCVTAGLTTVRSAACFLLTTKGVCNHCYCIRYVGRVFDMIPTCCCRAKMWHSSSGCTAIAAVYMA